MSYAVHSYNLSLFKLHIAAIIARNLIELSTTSVGNMATIYPADHPTMAKQPFSLQEYYASCHANGSLTLVLMPISRHSQNILKSSNHSASISVWSQRPAASRARVSLMGSVTVFEDPKSMPERQAIEACYLSKHPDASWWLPDTENGAHLAYWARFDPHDIYFVGGFGGQHYIGYIPLQTYQDASPKNIPNLRPAGRILLEQG
ncbi:pyridoxamine 5'-phosphate oxidase-domain-containing protein [Hygrophoropsis aurantiaca]|uniref:Pyridoxamine 5'-phosphate oxidase-domain-containing protein n=1 Tax=Hygrophoropsis aurantiaca TaxID=72124 RepID=A0ACB8A739_9AGAM|nr:pyridoxamine 5'-phosphate oxidase-domain-containing protein [Hygrophoropsis aurantiaca]